MLGILANNANNPISFYHLAFIANRLHACPDFHLCLYSLGKPIAMDTKSAPCNWQKSLSIKTKSMYFVNPIALKIPAPEPPFPGQSFMMMHLKKPFYLAHGIQIHSYQD